MHRTVDRDRRTILVADAHRGDGKRLVVRADELNPRRKVAHPITGADAAPDAASASV